MKYRNYEVNSKNSLMDLKVHKWFSHIPNCNWWYIRDSRNLSGCAGVLFFVIIMIIFFCSVDSRKNSLGEKCEEKKAFVNILQLETNSAGKTSYCVRLRTGIQCSNFNKDTLRAVQEEINSFATEDSSPLILEFTNLQGSVETMKPNWLQILKNQIHSLKIDKTVLPTINQNTFEGEPFTQMQDLHLELVGELILTAGSFSGLHDLRSLSVTGVQITSASPETLLAVSSTLSNLQLSNCISNPKVLQNLTGGEPTFLLNNLILLEVQENAYRTLLANTFSKTPNLVSLYLERCNLMDSLDVNTFVGIIPKQVFMRFTKLTTLPKGIFDPFQYETVIYLSNNAWNCECSFQWFQEACNNNNIFECNGLQCFIGGKNYDLKTYTFCNYPSTGGSSTIDYSTPTSPTSVKTTTNHDSTKVHSVTTTEYISTTTSKTKRTTDNPITNPYPNEYGEDYCYPANRSTFNYIESSPSRIIYLGPTNIRVEFQLVANLAKYVVTLDESMENDIVFFLSNEDGWTICLTNVSNNFTLEGLEYGETYVVCMFHASQNSISMKNCQSLSVPQEWKNQSWISNGHKLPIIVGVVTGLVITITLSLLGMYVYIKRNPHIVYGKENVILIERENSSNKKSANDLNYEEQRYTPSLMSVSDGYMIPRLYESADDLQMPIPSLEPCAYQAASKVYPSVRLTNFTRTDSSEDIYESVNVWLSSSSSPSSLPTISHV